MLRNFLNNRKVEFAYGAIFDSVIRLTTLVIRGTFIFVSARYLSAQDFGLYVAISAVVALMQYVVAGDFSYIAHREFFSKRIRFDEMLRTQAVQMGFLFIIAIPFTLILLPKGIKNNIIIMSLFILALEALTSEIQRHLVAISRFTRASIILFIKSAGWMLPTLMLFATDNSSRSIEFIAIFWMIGLAASLLVGFSGIKENINSKCQVNIGLLKVYFEKILIVLIGTLAARSLFSVDRIIVEKLIGTEQAGIYGLFVGFAAAFIAILDAGILNRSYPALMRISEASRYEYNIISKKIEYKIILLTFIALVIYEITIRWLLSILEKNGYYEFSEIGSILIAAYGIYSLSFPANCRLYTLGKDKLITAFNLCSLVPFLTISYLSSVSANRVAFVIVACSLLHYLFRRIAVALFIDKC